MILQIFNFLCSLPTTVFLKYKRGTPRDNYSIKILFYAVSLQPHFVAILHKLAWISVSRDFLCNQPLVVFGLTPLKVECFYYVRCLFRLWNSKLVCLLPVGIFNYATFIWNICLLCFSCMPVNYKLMLSARLSACPLQWLLYIKIYIFLEY